MKSFVQHYWVTILGAIFLFGAFFEWTKNQELGSLGFAGGDSYVTKRIVRNSGVGSGRFFLSGARGCLFRHPRRCLGCTKRYGAGICRVSAYITSCI